ncbi:hypothetical protein EYF80_016671 [Liparis tanakae]|uniref:Uncharacterized protein n=1 Tax=Liparis tanakae TaxID=230148 RepID=A0A4Z2I6V4_9TELE|nr:hypothetical protein EYF80_016671 [Liparis tanakae]
MGCLNSPRRRRELKGDGPTARGFSRRKSLRLLSSSLVSSAPLSSSPRLLVSSNLPSLGLHSALYLHPRQSNKAPNGRVVDKQWLQFRFTSAHKWGFVKKRAREAQRSYDSIHSKVSPERVLTLTSSHSEVKEGDFSSLFLPVLQLETDSLRFPSPPSSSLGGDTSKSESDLERLRASFRSPGGRIRTAPKSLGSLFTVA